MFFPRRLVIQPQSARGIFRFFNAIVGSLWFGTQAVAYSHFSTVACIFVSSVVVTM